MIEKLLKPRQVLLDRFQIVQFIAEGGMQEVYKAIDTSFDRVVALKIPKNRSSEKRFDRSARMSARITHENVAKTLDFFSEDDRQFLVEELIDGVDLEKALDSVYYRFDPHLCAHFGHRFARGLCAAHHADVFHRDLKPSNIIVSADANLGVVKITDFGIAKMAAAEIDEAAAGGTESLNLSLTAMGALPYMAPELISAAKEAEKPADVWAFGAVLYRVFVGNEPFGRGLPAVPRILSDDLPDPPSIFEKKQFKALSDDLWDIIRACLQKEPGARPKADEVLRMFAELCYSDADRQFGMVSEVRPGTGKWGYLRSRSAQERIFYHEDSLFGAELKQDMIVSYSSFDGTPHRRAHPILVVKK